MGNSCCSSDSETLKNEQSGRLASDAEIDGCSSNEQLLRSEDLASVFAALSNPVRIDILRHVALHRNCGCKDITQTVPLAQSTVSQHLKVLANVGLIQVKVAHPRSHYDIDEELIGRVSRSVSEFLNSCCSSRCC